MAATSPFGKWPFIVRTVAAFAVFFVLTVVLQSWGGAYGNELGGHPDESAHYVTGLMVHDYLHEPSPLHPLRYAEEYYRHYPKVALGHWPPFFYGLQALWMSAFGTSRTSALLLIAAIAASLATLLWSVIRTRFGEPIAWTLGVLCIAAPLVQLANQLVMADVLVAVLCLLAVVLLGRYFDTERTRWSLAFGCVASLALLTKTTGAPLALVPPLAIALGSRWELLRQWGFWMSAPVVGLLCAPWYVLTWRMASNGLNPAGETLADKATKLEAIGRDSLAGFGPVLLILAAFGLWRIFQRRQPVDGVSLCVLCLAPGVLIFIMLTPLVTEPRYLLGLIAPVLWLSAAGLAAFGSLLPQGRKADRGWLPGAATILLFGLTTFSIPHKTCRGYQQVADFFRSRPDYVDSLVLINSDAVGEGMCVAEFAAQRRRQPRTVLRSSKLLCTSRWDNSDYRLLHKDTEDVQATLARPPIGLVILDRGVPKKRWLPHNGQLERAVLEQPERWKQIASFPIERTGARGSLEVYELIGHQQMPRHSLEIDMRHSLDRGILMDAGGRTD